MSDSDNAADFTFYGSSSSAKALNDKLDLSTISSTPSSQLLLAKSITATPPV